MSYNKDFYSEYEKYLSEPRVRNVHDQMFAFFDVFAKPKSQCVIDLGCGRSLEYHRHQPWSYYGFDVNATVEVDYVFGRETSRTTSLDYRENTNKIIDIGKNKKAGKFVSLFSSEITAPPEENKCLYEGLFRNIPSLEFGMVSGFYYADKKNHLIVVETGGVKSWQTLSSIEDSVSDVYDEIRLYAECPSEMFGEDVVEVWRFLSRK